MKTAPAAGWNTQVTFNEAGWANASVSGPSYPVGSHQADQIWDSPNPFAGSTTVYLRKVSTAPGPALTAVMDLAVDDDVQLWINGTLVINNADCVAGEILGTNVQPYLVPGQNLIAAVVHDCGFSHGFGLYMDVTYPATGSLLLDPLEAGLPDFVFVNVLAVELQPDGKILVGGSFTTAGVGCGATPCPAIRNNIARWHQDGSLDLSFDPGTNAHVQAIAVQPDGKVLLGGGFSTIGGGGTGTVSRPFLARLNADGTVDQTFDAGVNGYVSTIVVQLDGKILVGGGFTSLGVGAGAMPRSFLGRLNADGSVDPGFDPGANNAVSVLSRQPDGRIFVGGQFTMLGGGGSGTTPRNRIGLLGSDGVLDGSFHPDVSHSSSNGSVSSITVQPDGKILVGGFFTTINFVARLALARLTTSGVVDNFDAGLSYFLPDIGRASTVLQADGKIVVFGIFDSVGVGLRPGLGRLNLDGSLDQPFDPQPIGPSLGRASTAVRLDDLGRILVGGEFRKPEGAARDHLARFKNTDPALQAVNVSGAGTVVTWMRSGSSAEVDRVTFESTTDGLTWTMLGAGTRIAGGWELTGQSLPAGAVVRARGFVGGSILEGVYLPTGVNFIRNPSFTNGTAEWLQYATPDESYMVSAVTSGVFEFWRAAPPAGTSNQAVVFQDTGLPIPKGAPMVAQFQLGNSDSAWKRMTVILHDRAFGDLAACLFWLAPSAPLRTYQLAARPTQIVANATLSFYAATVGSLGGSYRLDNVSLQHVPGAAFDKTICTDPTTPAPAGGAAGSNLLGNSDFASGSFLPWSTFGQIQAQVTGGVAEFIRLPGTPGGTILQSTGQPVGAGEILTATLALGNSSSVRKRVMIIVHDADFSDLAGCSFWIPPGQVLTTFTLRLYAREAWTNTTLSIYPATVGPDQWIRLDDATLRRTPSAAIVGTECEEPAASFDASRLPQPSKTR